MRCAVFLGLCVLFGCGGGSPEALPTAPPSTPSSTPTTAPTPGPTLTPQSLPTPLITPTTPSTTTIATATAPPPIDLFAGVGLTARDVERARTAETKNEPLTARRPESFQNDNGQGVQGVQFAFSGRTGVYIASASIQPSLTLNAPPSGLNVLYGPTVKPSGGCGEFSIDYWSYPDGTMYRGIRVYNVCTGQWTEITPFTDIFLDKYVRYINGASFPGLTLISEFDPILGQKTVVYNYRDSTWDVDILLDNTVDNHGGWVYAPEFWWNNSPCPPIIAVGVAGTWIMQNGGPWEPGSAATLSPIRTGACFDQTTITPVPWTSGSWNVTSP